MRHGRHETKEVSVYNKIGSRELTIPSSDMSDQWAISGNLSGSKAME
jgi:hypothetical protein